MTLYPICVLYLLLFFLLLLFFNKEFILFFTYSTEKDWKCFWKIELYQFFICEHTWACPTRNYPAQVNCVPEWKWSLRMSEPFTKGKSFSQAYQEEFKNPDLRTFPSGSLMNSKSEQWLVHRTHSLDADHYQEKSEGADFQANGHLQHTGINGSQGCVWDLRFSSPSVSAVIYKSP